MHADLAKKYETIWIDLTDFVDWQGHFTGIQRVEYELASRFAELPNVKFFFYHPIRASFIETGFDQIKHKAKIASGEVKISDKELKKQIRISKRLVKKFKESIPEGPRMSLVRIKGRLQRIGEASPHEPKHPFKQKDLVLMLGGNWAFATFVPSMMKVKAKTPGLKTVHILFDLIPVMQPAFFPQAMEKSFGKYVRGVLQSANLCMSISEFTKKDAEVYSERVGIKAPKIIPFRLGDDFEQVESEKPNPLKVEKGRFILLVGTIEVRKNHQLMYYVAKLAKERGIKLPKIVIIGKTGWLSDGTSHLLKYDPELQDELFIRKDCSDNEMTWFYQNCLFTVYPSYYEGWGLPIAESLNYGKLCLVANSSSMPEVGGKLVEYFSPYNPEECLDLIVKYLDQKKLKAAENQIKDKYKPTTWDATFEDFFEKTLKNL